MKGMSNGLVDFNAAEGNPGCLQFMMEAYSKEMFQAETAFRRLVQEGITGTKLYMLWNDCCGRDTTFTLKIMRENSIDDIVEHINYENGRGIPYSK